MVKSVLGVNHQGLQDWVIQRLSAVVMVVYLVFMTIYLFSHADLSFIEWHALFAKPWMKIATLLFIAALLYHAWIGMWTIFTDYIKPFALRSVLDCLVLLLLISCFIWGVMMLWSV